LVLKKIDVTKIKQNKERLVEENSNMTRYLILLRKVGDNYSLSFMLKHYLKSVFFIDMYKCLVWDVLTPVSKYFYWEI